jgi:hypothetical protein
MESRTARAIAVGALLMGALAVIVIIEPASPALNL